MERQIPIYFDNVSIIDTPIQELSTENPNLGRLKVRVFTKYANRNGSYITEEVANQLIESAINVPVVGFFDPETQSWASHTGPTLANGYGYVESFLGWEPFTDTDGITRDYAVFSVILFTKYFEEAKKILGQNQSMELDAASITGDWAVIENQEYFVYTTAKMLGFCVIGSHEPCFSVSAFFSKNDAEYRCQYEKFSSLLAELKVQVEEILKGGEQPMNEFENNPEVVEQETVAPTPEQEVAVEYEAVSEPQPELENEGENAEEVAAEPTEFEKLQQQFNDLQTSYAALQAELEEARTQISELENFQQSAKSELAELNTKNNELQQSLSTYEAQIASMENEKKNALIEKYEKVIDEEEINQIRMMVNDCSYDELESKLAITFAHKTMTGSEVKKIPLPEKEESEFALLMKKYRKN